MNRLHLVVYATLLVAVVASHVMSNTGFGIFEAKLYL